MIEERIKKWISDVFCSLAATSVPSILHAEFNLAKIDANTASQIMHTN